jgi:MFS family permease
MRMEECAVAEARRAGVMRSPAYAWYVVAVLVVAYALSFLDRQVLSLLVEPIKRDLSLSDTGISLLQGFAFALFNAFGGLPIGRLVDTSRRMTIIPLGIAFWSLMTAGCGLAQSFASLLLCRMGVGVGEAALTPAACSVIADYVPPRRLGLALGIFSMGVHLGAGLAFVLGAQAIAWLSLGGGPIVPGLGRLHPWQGVFLLVGLPGLAVAAWAASLREPARRGAEAADVLPLAEVLAYFRQNFRPLGGLMLCSAFASMTSYGVNAWMPSFFIRSFGWSAAEAGRAYGPVIIVCGVLGVLAGGLAGDFLTGRGRRHGRLLIMAGSAACALPFTVAAPLMRDPALALAFLVPATFFGTVIIGTGPAALQEILPNRMRGLGTSVAVLVVNLIGLGLGPTAIALTTDFVLRDEAQLRYALAIVPLATLSLSCAFGIATLKPYRTSRSNIAL